MSALLAGAFEGSTRRVAQRGGGRGSEKLGGSHTRVCRSTGGVWEAPLFERVLWFSPAIAALVAGVVMAAGGASNSCATEPRDRVGGAQRRGGRGMRQTVNMSEVWKWITSHQLAGWIGVTAGSLLAALILRDGQGAVVALAVGALFVLLSLAVNGLLDWWDRRKGTAGT